MRGGGGTLPWPGGGREAATARAPRQLPEPRNRRGHVLDDACRPRSRPTSRRDGPAFPSRASGRAGPHRARRRRCVLLGGRVHGQRRRGGGGFAPAAHAPA